MPKITNYTAKHEEALRNGYKWVHDEKDHIRVLVTKDTGHTSEEWGDEIWHVEVWNYAHNTELGPIGYNREEVKSIAIDWMKDNPDGWEPSELLK